MSLTAPVLFQISIEIQKLSADLKKNKPVFNIFNYFKDEQ